jgi:sodium/potassium-transporting ATPase subunit beta
MAGGDGKTANDTKPAQPVAQAQFQFAQKPETKPGWEGFKEFIWNSETSEFLGRTGCSWFKIGLFYVIYYACLAGFFMAMLVVFYQTLDDEVPKWLNSNGIIGDNPGMGFRPRPPDEHIDSTLVNFRHGSTVGNFDGWVKDLDKFLENYRNGTENAKSTPEIIECGFNMNPGEGQICKVNSKDLMQSNCTRENKYGFEEGKPCILLKLNRIYGWKPEPYHNSSDLPEHAPAQLKKYVQALEKSTSGEAAMVGRVIWFTCEGENPADIEKLGEISYYPYKNQRGYLSPAVFLHLKNPKHGVLLSIECKAWARNIRHVSMDRQGSVHFELLVD